MNIFFMDMVKKIALLLYENPLNFMQI
jgi:hypothetical protein